MEGLDVTKSMITEKKTNNTISGKGLWNPKSFIFISVLFSFLPAVTLYSINYGRAGYARKRNVYLISGLLLFIFLVTISFFIDGVIVKALFYGLNIGIGFYMKNDQIILYNEHINASGKKASLLIPILVCIAFLIFAIWAIVNSANIPDKKVIIQGDELYYTDNIKKEELDKLGAYLEENGVLVNDNKSISVKIDKKSNIYIFSIVINKEYLDSNDTLELGKSLSQYLSSDVFNNLKVDVNFCDNRFNSLKTVSY